MKEILVVCILILVVGCSQCTDNFNWRKDTAPIVKRIPALSSCTNILWHAEVITKQSMLSVPGPSTYRILCCVPNADIVLTGSLGGEMKFHPEQDQSLFVKAEIERMKIEYGIEVNEQMLLSNDDLTAKLIIPPYWGRCVYFEDKKVLCVVLYGE